MRVVYFIDQLGTAVRSARRHLELYRSPLAASGARPGETGDRRVA